MNAKGEELNRSLINRIAIAVAISLLGTAALIEYAGPLGLEFPVPVNWLQPH